MFAIFSKTIIIYIGVFAGYLFIISPLKKYRKLFINITINIFTTLLTYVSFVKINNFENNEWLFPILASLLVTVFGYYTPIVLAKFTGKERPKPAELCTASFSNALNFPFPIIFALTPGGLGAAGLYLGTGIIMRNTIGFYISGYKFNKQALYDIIKFPPIWGIITGIISRVYFQDILLPVMNLPSVNFIFQVGIFATLMTIGFSLKKPDFNYLQSYFRVGVTRYVVSLILALLIIIPFKLHYLIAIPILVQMISPPAAYNVLYAEKLNLDTEMTSQIIIFLTLIALIILPLELFIIQILFLA